jgi:hypothetical protein
VNIDARQKSELNSGQLLRGSLFVNVSRQKLDGEAVDLLGALRRIADRRTVELLLRLGAMANDGSDSIPP